MNLNIKNHKKDIESSLKTMKFLYFIKIILLILIILSYYYK